MTTFNPSRNEALLDAAAAQDALRVAAERGENVNVQIDPNTLTKEQAAKIMSEEHRILGYRPPPHSLAAQAQRATDKKSATNETVANEGMSHREEAKLVAAAAQDALRISAERGEHINVNVNPAALSKEEAARIQSEEHRILGHRPPAGSLAAQVQSAADRKETGTGQPVTKDIASGLMSQEHKGMGYGPPSGSIASQAQSLADQNANDGGNRSLDPAVTRIGMGVPVTKSVSSGPIVFGHG